MIVSRISTQQAHAQRQADADLIALMSLRGLNTYVGLQYGPYVVCKLSIKDVCPTVSVFDTAVMHAVGLIDSPSALTQA